MSLPNPSPNFRCSLIRSSMITDALQKYLVKSVSSRFEIEIQFCCFLNKAHEPIIILTIKQFACFKDVIGKPEWIIVQHQQADLVCL